MRSEESIRGKYGYAVSMLKKTKKERLVRSRVLAYWQGWWMRWNGCWTSDRITRWCVMPDPKTLQMDLTQYERVEFTFKRTDSSPAQGFSGSPEWLFDLISAGYTVLHPEDV